MESWEGERDICCYGTVAARRRFGGKSFLFLHLGNVWQIWEKSSTPTRNLFCHILWTKPCWLFLLKVLTCVVFHHVVIVSVGRGGRVHGGRVMMVPPRTERFASDRELRVALDLTTSNNTRIGIKSFLFKVLSPPPAAWGWGRQEAVFT